MMIKLTKLTQLILSFNPLTLLKRHSCALGGDILFLEDLVMRHYEKLTF